jgi:hypothetical protein
MVEEDIGWFLAKGKGQLQTYWLESRRLRSIDPICQRQRGALDGECHVMLAMHESNSSIEILLLAAAMEPKTVNSSLENENHESSGSDENITTSSFVTANMRTYKIQ